MNDILASRHRLPVAADNQACLKTFRLQNIAFFARSELQQLFKPVSHDHKRHLNCWSQVLVDAIILKSSLDHGIIVIYDNSKCDSEDVSAAIKLT